MLSNSWSRRLALGLAPAVLIPPVLRDLGGRFLIPELPVGTAIAVDCTAGDWPGSALSVSITDAGGGGPTGTLKLMVKHPDDALAPDTLYVFAQINDATSNIGGSPDRAVLMFDLTHNHASDVSGSWVGSADRGIKFDRGNFVHRVYGTITNPTDDENAAAFPVPRECIMEDGPGGWSIEAKILPSDLGLNAFNALMGAAFLVTDAAIPANGRWPGTATTTLSTWANVVTRQPIDYILLIDQSGSMAGTKWTSVKQAGDNFALVLSKVKDNIDGEYAAMVPAMSGDRLGLANFTWTDPATDNSSQVVPLAAIPASPGSFTGGLPSSPGGWTPIAGGINRTFTMLGGAPGFGGLARTRVVMLLSDGIHNRPTSTIDFATQGVSLNYLPTPCGSNSLVRINTVAVGSDATVDVTKLNQIKDCYAGSTFLKPDGLTVNTYNTADPAEPQLTAQLTKFFTQTLTPYYQWNLINNTGAAFSVNAGDRKLLLFAFWDNKGDAVNLSVTKPDMSVATGSSDATLGFSWLVIDNPPNGNYTSFTATGATAKFVFVDLRVRGDFGVDNQQHGTGGTILLRAKLQDRGRPVTGATVRADMARPGEGFGTYVSTHSLGSCERSDPRLPRDSAIGITRGAQPPARRTATGTNDVPLPRFALINELFSRCGKSGLNRLTDPGLVLYDDATHGDATAADGIYTLAMDNTNYEGSYVFRFRANGTNSDGAPFARMREVATYVGVIPSPDNSPTGSFTLSTSGNIVTSRYWVTPRDRRGEYFGPGYPEKVRFDISGGGATVGPVIDHNNGIYSQVIQYNKATDHPVVTPVVNGVRIEPTGARYAWEFVVPFVAYTQFDDTLGIDPAIGVGARLGYHFASQLTLEAEGAISFADATGGRGSGNFVQALANLRWDVQPLAIGKIVPHVTIGAGHAWFRDFGADADGALFQAGVGATYKVKSNFGLRVDGRALRMTDVGVSGATTSVQITAGLVWYPFKCSGCAP